jgi:hypothetical protein
MISYLEIILLKVWIIMDSVEKIPRNLTMGFRSDLKKIKLHQSYQIGEVYRINAYGHYGLLSWLMLYHFCSIPEAY